MIKYTELKDYKRHNLIDEIPLKKPYTILIEPSNFCNFQCVSCFQSLKHENYITRNRQVMSMEMFEKIIGQLRDWEGEKIKVLKLSLYGEPFTNKNFIRMLEIAKKSNIAERIETTTNASLLSRDLSNDLVKYEMDYMRVSIYGGNQESYYRITNCQKANIEEIWTNLKYIQELKQKNGKERPFISAKMLDTYTEENEEFLNKFSKVSDEVYIDKPHNWIATKEKSFIGSLYDDDKQEQLIQEQEKCMSNRIACTMPFTTLAIRSNGEVSPCCIDWSGGTNIGNINDQSLKEIWEGDCLYEFRKMQLENRKTENISCKNCDFYKNDYYIKDNIDGFPVKQLRG
mgnify:CR=1 FL=1